MNDPSSPTFRLDACLRKALGKELSPEEWEVIREVNRIQGWDRDNDRRPEGRDVKQARGEARQSGPKASPSGGSHG